MRIVLAETPSNTDFAATSRTFQLSESASVHYTAPAGPSSGLIASSIPKKDLVD